MKQLYRIALGFLAFSPTAFSEGETTYPSSGESQIMFQILREAGAYDPASYAAPQHLAADMIACHGNPIQCTAYVNNSEKDTTSNSSRTIFQLMAKYGAAVYPNADQQIY